MEIYGRTPAEVYRLLAWQHKVIIFFGILFLLFTFIYVPYAIYHATSDEVAIQILPLTDNRVELNALEPSITNDGKSGAVMAFTSMELMADNSVQTGVRLARGVNDCRSMTVQPGFLFALRPDELLKTDGVTPLKSGYWHSEAPSIVYDPADAGREWKAFAYRYFWAGDRNLARLYSMIIMRTSNSSFSNWSEERWLFSANPQSPPAPYNQLVEQHLSRLHPSLGNIAYYARPSVIATKGVLLMSLTAFTADKPTADRVILLASTDHGQNWRYLGTPLSAADAAKVGKYSELAGATLLQQDGQVLLAAVYGDDKLSGNGTVIHTFSSVPKAQLNRDAKTGAPVVAALHPLPSVKPGRAGGGFAAYHDSCKKSGMIVSALSDITKKFEMFKLMKKPLEQ